MNNKKVQEQYLEEWKDGFLSLLEQKCVDFPRASVNSAFLLSGHFRAVSV